MAENLTKALIDDGETGEAIPPEHSIGYQVLRVNHDMTEAMARFVGRHGISGPHWGYLRHIYFADGLSQRELSDRMARQGATTVTALKRLEKAGLVESRAHESDQRKNRIYLTEKGRKLVTELMPHVREVEEIAFRGFNPKEVDAFWDALGRMRRNFNDAREGRL